MNIALLPLLQQIVLVLAAIVLGAILGLRQLVRGFAPG